MSFALSPCSPIAIPETRSISSPSITCRAPGDYSPLGRTPFRPGFATSIASIASSISLPMGGELRHPVEPARSELRALVVLEKILARDAVALGEPHQAALVADQALVDVVELLDQRVDASLIEP